MSVIIDPTARPPNEVARGLSAKAAARVEDDGLTPEARALKRLEALKNEPVPMLSAEALATLKRNVVVDE
jgi:hypothetical protein